jgi:hypothetical protein
VKPRKEEEEEEEVTSCGLTGCDEDHVKRRRNKEEENWHKHILSMNERIHQIQSNYKPKDCSGVGSPKRSRQDELSPG